MISAMDPPIAASAVPDDERAAVRKAQEVIERSSPTINQVCLIALTLIAITYTLYFAAAIILPFVLALFLTALLSPALQLMNRRLRVPRAIAALILIFAVFMVVWAVGYLVVVPASNWIAKIPQSLPTLIEKLSFLQRPMKLLEQGLKAFQDAVPSDGAQKVVEVKQSTDVGGKMLGIGTTVLAGGRAFVGQGLTVMLLLFFFLASSESLLRRIVEIMPRFDDKRRACLHRVRDRGKHIPLPSDRITHECAGGAADRLRRLVTWNVGPRPVRNDIVASQLCSNPRPAYGRGYFLLRWAVLISNRLPGSFPGWNIPRNPHTRRGDGHADAARASVHSQSNYGDFVAHLLGLVVGHSRSIAFHTVSGSH